MRHLILRIAVLLCLVAAPAVAADKPLVILISIDGFRADYLDRGVTPNLSRLAAEGARGALRPSFPSKTFPNHYTLVTGLRPDRHGVIDNVMEDAAIPGVTFRMSNQAAVVDARWWNGATPIWITAERAGIPSATMFWPGSEAAIQGGRPSYWKPFNQALPSNARVDQVLAWLDLSERRPGFVTLYFDEVDTAGHNPGPDSPALNAALGRVDTAIGRLVSGLKAQGLEADLVITADHGMAATSKDRLIYLEDIVAPDVGARLAMGAYMTLTPAPGREVEAERALLRRHPHMTCWRKGEIPRRFHFGRHPRVPPIFCLPQTGWEITTREFVARRPVSPGNHGFDPYSPEMAAIFIAHGPHIRAGARLRATDNVHVYPLVARLLGVTPEAGDGRLTRLGRALRD